MPFADVHGIRIYYERAGAGPPLLYLNWTGGDLRDARIFAGPLEDAFDVLAYDQRGLGQSAKPDVPYTMRDYADDAAAMLDFAGWDRAPVVGVSFGGMVAQELAIRHPDRVDRLVLACTSSGGAGRPSYPLHELAALPPDEATAFGVGLIDSRFEGTDPAAAPAEIANLLTAMKKTQPSTGSAEEQETAAGARRQLEARRGHDTYDLLGSITASAFVCGGRYDRIAPPENLEALAAAIPNASLQLFEGGHVFFWQDPAAWPAIVAFLKEGS